jgi:hypothetical protein
LRVGPFIFARRYTYARKLSDVGVCVTLLRYNGTIYNVVMLNALADTRGVRASRRRPERGVRLTAINSKSDYSG